MKPITDEKRADIVRLKQKGKKDIDIAEWLDISVGVVKKFGANSYIHQITLRSHTKAEKARFQLKWTKK